MKKIHYRDPEWRVIDTACGTKSSKTTAVVSDVTCKRCLTFIERNAYTKLEHFIESLAGTGWAFELVGGNNLALMTNIPTGKIFTFEYKLYACSILIPRAVYACLGLAQKA